MWEGDARSRPNAGARVSVPCRVLLRLEEQGLGVLGLNAPVSGLRQFGAGFLVAGLAVATRARCCLLEGVEPTDPATFAAIALLVAAVTLTASWLPARRAGRVDPVDALRAE